MPRFGRTGTEVAVGDGVTSTAPAGRESARTSAGTKAITEADAKAAAEDERLKNDIHIKIDWLIVLL